MSAIRILLGAILFVTCGYAAAGCNGILGIPEISHKSGGGDSGVGTVEGGGPTIDAGSAATPRDATAVADASVEVGGGVTACASCAFPHGSGLCVDGSCALGACEPGYSDCNKDSADGCEAHLADDPNNCSECGSACRDQFACADSTCVCTGDDSCGRNGSCGADGSCECDGTTCDTEEVCRYGECTAD